MILKYKALAYEWKVTQLKMFVSVDWDRLSFTVIIFIK